MSVASESTVDEETLQFYRGNAEAYAGREITSRQARLTAFLALLPPGAAILELGCGAGGDTAEMLARGFDVRADRRIAGNGCGRLEASRPHRSRRCCFTTSTRSRPMTASGPTPACCTCRGTSLRDVLALIWRALKAGGDFFASYKTGDAEGRDTLNRYYNYPSPDWLRTNYASAGNWSSLEIETGEVIGFDNQWAPMLFVVARKGR